MRMSKAEREFYELMIAWLYLCSECPVCHRLIETVDEFKVARFGHGDDLVHAGCWDAYVRLYPPPVA